MSAPPSSAPPADRAHRPRRRPGPGRDRRQRPRHPRGGRPQILEPFYTTKPVGQGTGRGHLEQVLRIYLEHYNRHRPHRALGLAPPGPSPGLTLVGEDRRARVHRRDLLGGYFMSTDELHERIYAPYARRAST